VITNNIPHTQRVYADLSLRAFAHKPFPAIAGNGGEVLISSVGNTLA